MVHKKPAAAPFQIVQPKKGKQRMLRKFTSTIKKKPSTKVKYVRHDTPSQKARNDRICFKTTLKELLGKTEDQITKQLLSDGMLEKNKMAKSALSVRKEPLVH